MYKSKCEIFRFGSGAAAGALKAHRRTVPLQVRHPLEPKDPLVQLELLLRRLVLLLGGARVADGRILVAVIKA